MPAVRAPYRGAALALNDAVDVEVFDCGGSVAESCLVPGRHYFLTPGFGLLARVPDLDGQIFNVFTLRDGRIVRIDDYRGRREALTAAGVAEDVDWR